jgi:hypothetical protein
MGGSTTKRRWPDLVRREAMLRVLDEGLGRKTGGASGYSLAADLIPRKGVSALQSTDVPSFGR